MSDPECTTEGILSGVVPPIAAVAGGIGGVVLDRFVPSPVWVPGAAAFGYFYGKAMFTPKGNKDIAGGIAAGTGAAVATMQFAPKWYYAIPVAAGSYYLLGPVVAVVLTPSTWILGTALRAADWLTGIFGWSGCQVAAAAHAGGQAMSGAMGDNDVLPNCHNYDKAQVAQQLAEGLGRDKTEVAPIAAAILKRFRNPSTVETASLGDNPKTFTNAFAAPGNALQNAQLVNTRCQGGKYFTSTLDWQAWRKSWLSDANIDKNILRKTSSAVTVAPGPSAPGNCAQMLARARSVSLNERRVWKPLSDCTKAQAQQINAWSAAKSQTCDAFAQGVLQAAGADRALASNMARGMLRGYPTEPDTAKYIDSCSATNKTMLQRLRQM